MKIKFLKHCTAAVLAVTMLFGFTGCGAAEAALEKFRGGKSVSAGTVSEETFKPEQTEALTESAAAKVSAEVSAYSEVPSGEETEGLTESAEFLAALDNVASDVGSAQAPAKSHVEEILQSMTLEQKVAQLFFVSPEGLTGVDGVSRTGDVMRESFLAYPVGGILYSTPNLLDPEQTSAMTRGLQSFAMETMGIPVFISIDEEGGKVTRIAKNDAFGVQNVGNMADIGSGSSSFTAEEAGSYIGEYLNHYGFNMDFAPDADVLTNPNNTVIGKRSFGSDPNQVAAMAYDYARSLQAKGVLACYKHFPGHGGTGEDSHEGYAYTYKSKEELRACDLIPFEEGIRNGLQVIMVSHVSCPGVTGSDTPATLSKEIVTGILREELGFGGILITDALDMGAISNHYEKTEACIRALEAGCDMLLIGGSFKGAYDGVLEAVQSGRITESRIDESLRRILTVKETVR